MSAVFLLRLILILLTTSIYSSLNPTQLVTQLLGRQIVVDGVGWRWRGRAIAGRAGRRRLRRTLRSSAVAVVVSVLVVLAVVRLVVRRVVVVRTVRGAACAASFLSLFMCLGFVSLVTVHVVVIVTSRRWISFVLVHNELVYRPLFVRLMLSIIEHFNCSTELG